MELCRRVVGPLYQGLYLPDTLWSYHEPRLARRSEAIVLGVVFKDSGVVRHKSWAYDVDQSSFLTMHLEISLVSVILNNNDSGVSRRGQLTTLPTQFQQIFSFPLARRI
jgi:hypothetical protein